MGRNRTAAGAFSSGRPTRWGYRPIWGVVARTHRRAVVALPQTTVAAPHLRGRPRPVGGARQRLWLLHRLPHRIAPHARGRRAGCASYRLVVALDSIASSNSFTNSVRRTHPPASSLRPSSV